MIRHTRLEPASHKPLKTYTKEFRAEAVKLLLAQGLTLDEAAQRLLIPKDTLGNWVSAAKRSADPAAASGSRCPVTARSSSAGRTDLRSHYPFGRRAAGRSGDATLPPASRCTR